MYPCSINPPPACVYVRLQMGTLRPVYGDTFSECLPRGIMYCSHCSDPLLHLEFNVGDRVFYTRSNGVRVPAAVVGFVPNGLVHLEYFQDAVKVVNWQCKVESIPFAIPSADSLPPCSRSPSPSPDDRGRSPSKSATPPPCAKPRAPKTTQRSREAGKQLAATVCDIWPGSHEDLHANTRILLNCSCMLLEVAGFRGCYQGKHRNNWRYARAVHVLCENAFLDAKKSFFSCAKKLIEPLKKVQNI